MKLSFYLTLLLLTTQLVRAQQPPAAVCRPEVKYDRHADVTTVQCELLEQVVATGRLIVQAGASYQGKEPDESARFWLGLASYKAGARRRTPPSFKTATTLTLLADAVRLEVAVKDYRQEFFELNRLLAEQAQAEISREDLRKLLSARSLAGNWGGVAFTLSGTALAALKEFITRQLVITNSGQ